MPLQALAQLSQVGLNEHIVAIVTAYQEFCDKLLHKSTEQGLKPRFAFPPIIIAGPTASGKSHLAMQIAELLDAYIINADSMQIYREIPIISAQPSGKEMQQVPHKLYGYISILQAVRFSVADWLEAVMQAIANAQQAGRVPILVGGTGMYIAALLHGINEIPPVAQHIMTELETRMQRDGICSLHEELALVDPGAYTRIERHDKQRILRALGVFYSSGLRISQNYQWKIPSGNQQSNIAIMDAKSGIGRGNVFGVYLQRDREALYNTINGRVNLMLKSGLIEEITELKRQIDASGLAITNLPKAIGLQETLAMVAGELNQATAVEQMQKKTRNFAKRQMTWFKNQLEFDFIFAS